MMKVRSLSKVWSHHGDCRQVVRRYPSNYFDSIVTDPPYGLSFLGRAWDHGVPGEPFWRAFLRVCKPGATLFAFGGTRTYHRLAVAIEDAGWEIRDCLVWLYGSGFPKNQHIGKAIERAGGAGTELARLWDGWGTCLKPAWEPVIVAMKPLDGTYVENAGRWGVAGLNLDGARVPAEAGYGRPVATPDGLGEPLKATLYKGGWRRIPLAPSALGRFPANVVVDEAAGRAVDRAAGRASTGFFGPGGGEGPSRFFYTAKAGTPERMDCPHPTIKPISLMRWLCRLSGTPTGGRVLEPFGGSGTTAVAAAQEGRRCVIIEKGDAEYADMVARLRRFHVL